MTALFLILALAGPAPATDCLTDANLLTRAEASFDAALARHESGQDARPLFQAAAADYTQLRDRGRRSAALELNLGKCSLLAGDLPAAILAFRRAARLDPTDAEARDLLAWSRSQVPHSEAVPLTAPHPNPVSLPWLPDRLAWVGFALSYAVAWLALARTLVARRAAWLAVTVAALVTAAGLGLLLLARAHEHADSVRRPAVVVAEDGVLLRTGNGSLYPPRIESPLPRGLEARLLGERAGWALVELPGGLAGWAPSSSLLVDYP